VHGMQPCIVAGTHAAARRQDELSSRWPTYEPVVSKMVTMSLGNLRAAAALAESGCRPSGPTSSASALCHAYTSVGPCGHLSPRRRKPGKGACAVGRPPYQ
jgi:hypothetical protein